MPQSSFSCRVVFLLLAGMFQTQAAVVINEIHYRPPNKLDQAEFIELHNTGGSTVALSGWRIEGGVEYAIANATELPPGGFLVVAQNPSTMLAKFGVSALGPWKGRLNNQGEEVRLINAAGGLEDSVDYKLGFPWPTLGDPPGYSMELIHPDLDNDLGGSWRASFNPSTQNPTGTLISKGSQWRYFKGIGEPSTPKTAWRQRGFNDISWVSGPMPIGYDPSIPMGVSLNDMRRSYTMVYFRRPFVVQDASKVRSLKLSALYDDGFKIWINGVPVPNGDVNMAAGEVPYTGTASRALELNTYQSFTLESPQNYLVSGTNIIAIQAANSSRDNSSDFYLDVELTAVTGSPNYGPTPGSANSVFSTNAPPQIRQVRHSPEQPLSDQQVTITAKVTDPDGVASVQLQYQVVAPGNYIALTDPQYTNAWTTVSMNDDGAHGDQVAGDNTYSIVLPGSLQSHRQLVRYRITTRDSLEAEVRVPYADDPAPNFAYFCYNGIPGWRGALRPGTTPTTEFSPEVMSRLPAIHLVSKQAEVEQATWFSRYSGDAYPWIGTLVYDGQVYDHIHYRPRGGSWRYAMVKNMWKFDLNNGHDFFMRDDYGRKYKTGWTKLNLGASIQQGDYLHRGEQGMFESVGFRLFNLAGVESPNTAFVQFRVVDAVMEAPSDQYAGDFWGVYLAIEQEDGRFLDEHALPDGNLYKMEGGSGELNNLGLLGPANKSDLNSFLNTYRNSSSPATETWWRANLDLRRYASYQAIVQGIHHYDISDGKNYFYFRNPDSGLWSVHSWDLDLTWANNMYRTDGGGKDDLFRPVLGGENNHPVKPAMTIDFKNRIREIRDLLFNSDQAGALIEEHAGLLRGSRGQLSILDADRFMWDYNPKMLDPAYSSTLSKAGQGRFYQWPNEPGVSKTFEGVVQLMKNYVVERSAVLSTMAADPLIPPTPVINYAGTTNYPVDAISFRHEPVSGTGPLVIIWRVGEISWSNAPAFDPALPRAYEITSVWESGVMSASDLNEVQVPAGLLKTGRVYRARARVGDGTGRWSFWSAPVQFTPSSAGNAAALVESLRLTEMMVEPPAGTDFEFVELHNLSDSDVLDLNGVRFASGIDYTFLPGTTLAPASYLVLIKHPEASVFRQYYGLDPSIPVFGPYGGSLDNSGEEIKLQAPGGEVEICSFKYSSGRGWPLAAQAGHSLVPMAAAQGQGTGALDYGGNWRASTFMKGSPGHADPSPPAPLLRLNEVKAHTDHTDPLKPEYDSNDWIELFNASSEPILLAGYYLSDDTGNLRKFALPGVSIPARGFIVFDEVSGFHSPLASGFGLNKAGEQILLSYLPGTDADRVADEVRFKGEVNESSLGRFPDGAPWWFHSMETPAGPNRAPIAGVVIQEIMYRPVGTGDDNTSAEYIEIYNPGTIPVTLSDTNGPWRLSGGVGFAFPEQTALARGSVMLVVNFDPSIAANLEGFRSAYGITNGVQFFGPYSGKLGNRGDRVALEKPQAPDMPGDPVSWVIVDEVIYGNQSPWPLEANGGGQALNRLVLTRHGCEPANWLAAAPTPGTVSSPSGDIDGDGMPDDWEGFYQLLPGDPGDAHDDPDEDDMTNLEEFRAGTNPRDPRSRMELTAVREPSGGVTLQFVARADRSYTIEFRSNAESGSWQKLEDVDAISVERQVTIEDMSSEGFKVRFYRLVTPVLP